MIYAQRPWKKNLPASLQDYQFDATSIPQNLSELFDKAVHDFSDAAAFSLVLPTGLAKTLSFKQIQYYSDLLARYFQHELQLQPGDVVGLQMPNCLHYPIAVFACWKAGLIITNINPLYTARELEYQGEFKHEVRQFQKPYDNQQAEQISLMV
ncbi:AMP-binding protein [Acinetobacter sp. 869535]|uniref:AMP-binding protein n=1 Tax=Acinetobacter sp. 869535 TaxID=1310621 RepID=UPI0004B440F7|nr:AMP-binding protein [Acinetobacter sp. 869535]